MKYVLVSTLGIESNCFNTFSKVDDQSGYIFSPNYPMSSFGGETTCNWELTAPHSEQRNNNQLLYLQNIASKLTDTYDECTGMVTFGNDKFGNGKLFDFVASIYVDVCKQRKALKCDVIIHFCSLA